MIWLARNVIVNSSKEPVPKFLITLVAELFSQYNHNNRVFNLTMFRVLRHLNQVINPSRGQIDFGCSTVYCEANMLQFYVFSPDGDIYACPETVGQHQYSIGKYDKKLLLNTNKVNDWNNRTIFRIPKCKECKIAMFCGGGCAYAALSINGNIDSPVCDNAEKVLTQYIESIKNSTLETTLQRQ